MWIWVTSFPDLTAFYFCTALWIRMTAVWKIIAQNVFSFSQSCYSLEQSWIYAAVMQLFYIKASIFANHLVTNRNIKPWFSFPISVRASRSPVSRQAISQRVLSSMTLSQGENSHVGGCQICSQLKFLPEY